MRPDRTEGRAAAWVAWSLVALTVLFTVAHVTLWTLAEPVPEAVDTRGEAGLPIAFAGVGALIVTHRPLNRIGWLFCAGVVFALVPALDAYALYALAANPAAGLPAATAVAWVVSWIWLVDLLLVMLVPLLYPTGRLPSPRWRPVLWLTVLLVLVGMLANAVRPRPLEVSQVPVAPNPLGIPSAAGLVAAVDVVASVVGVLLFLAAVASVVLRFRHARGVERQQLKWFAYASLGMVLSFVLSGVLSSLLTTSGELLVDLISGIPMLGWPVALGIAILRYRLYDIDRLINRTLVYALLTAVLGAIYAGTVLLLGPWRWRRCSSRPVVASSRRSTGASTDANTTRPRQSRRSALACVMRLIWTHSRPRCWRWWTRRCSQPGRRCGFGNRRSHDDLAT
jgi:hypothetical protein